jgi:hypothetical protein
MPTMKDASTQLVRAGDPRIHTQPVSEAPTAAPFSPTGGVVMEQEKKARRKGFRTSTSIHISETVGAAFLPMKHLKLLLALDQSTQPLMQALSDSAPLPFLVRHFARALQIGGDVRLQPRRDPGIGRGKVDLIVQKE